MTEGHNIRVAEIGYKSNGTPAVFLWCRAHHRVHACTLEQMLHHFYLLSDNDAQLRINYLITLNDALSIVQNRAILDEKQESA